MFSNTLFQFLYRWDINLFNRKLKYFKKYIMLKPKKIIKNIVLFIYNIYNLHYNIKLLFLKPVIYIGKLQTQFWWLKACWYFFSIFKILSNNLIFRNKIIWVLHIYKIIINKQLLKWNIKLINKYSKQLYSFTNLLTSSFLNIVHQYKLMIRFKFLFNHKFNIYIWQQQYLNLKQIINPQSFKMITFLLLFIQLKFLWRNRLLLNLLLLNFILLTYPLFYIVSKILGTYIQIQLRVLFSKNEQKFFLTLILQLTKFFINKKPLFKYSFYNNNINALKIIITGRWQRKRWVAPFPKTFTQGKIFNFKYLNKNLIISYYQAPIYTRKGNIGLKLFLSKKINKYDF
jgi:hypothetical protein